MEVNELGSKSMHITTTIKGYLYIQLKNRGIPLSRALSEGAKKVLNPEEEVDVEKLQKMNEMLQEKLQEANDKLEKYENEENI